MKKKIIFNLIILTALIILIFCITILGKTTVLAVSKNENIIGTNQYNSIRDSITQLMSGLSRRRNCK